MTSPTRDTIFEQTRQKHLMTIGFLQTLKNHFNPDQAFTLAAESFSAYMKFYYQHLLRNTKPGSQKRFDTFRKHYKDCGKKTPYIQILESTPTTLKVKYTRCPFTEILNEYNLPEFSYAFCLSDPAFTKQLLPHVTFHRENVIAKETPYCDHTWTYTPPQKKPSYKKRKTRKKNR